MRSSFPLVLIALTGACATARIPVPEPLAATPEWEVRSRGWRSDRLWLGPYEAHRVDRDLRQRGGILDALGGKREYQQEYRFLLRDTAAAQDLWQVRCDNRDVERGVSVRGVRLNLEDRSSLECTFTVPPDSAAAWTMRVAARGDRLPAGVLRQAADSAGYQVLGQSWSGRVCCDLAGFVVRREGSAVLLVERTGRGRVRLHPEAAPEEAPLLAAAAVALLLREDLERP